ncbi:DNA protecting protein DprA [Rubrivirga marina]|uniref:DNA protecting protein DprA n=1 Tax=Rubrivirga marina TaxID=1196024 RepID=A0A271J723_9BACT|nr:DNA protecting protein DprA [Rubrivirga marina]
MALSLVPGVGPGRVLALLAALGSANAVMRAPVGRLVRAEGVGRQTAEAIRAWDDWPSVDAQFRRAASVGARLVALSDPEYPDLLRRIYDPPSHLWVRGRLTEADDLAVAIVGTRRASDYGRRVAEAFAGDLVAAGVTVVSGLAYGVDVAAHRAALAAGGRTIAVLGSGVDRIYPSRHAPVVRQILERDAGAVVSEFPLGAAPDAANFPRRNRVVSGLCRATVVAEAFETGGALLTAGIALEQNREVFAVPASVFTEAGGTNRQIQRGEAALATSAVDVLDAIAPQLETPKALPIRPEEPELPLNRVEQRLVDVLTTEPRPLDAVCVDADLDASTALVYLLQLEFRGVVRQLQGKQFART